MTTTHRSQQTQEGLNPSARSANNDPSPLHAQSYVLYGSARDIITRLISAAVRPIVGQLKGAARLRHFLFFLSLGTLIYSSWLALF